MNRKKHQDSADDKCSNEKIPGSQLIHSRGPDDSGEKNLVHFPGAGTECKDREHLKRWRVHEGSHTDPLF
jgi:hypothetical protein